jgi:peptide/nickel transport system substrate-binding protein
MKTLFRFVALVLCFAFVFCIQPCQAATKGKIKDSVVVVLRGEPSTLDPHNTSEMVAFTTQLQIFDTLVKKDLKGNPIPWLATKWEKIDNVTTRFYLREAYFHNGDRVTAEDVRFSIERATEMPTSRSMMDGFDGKKTKVVNDTTVDIVTKGPFAAILTYLSNSRACIVSRKAVEQMGKEGFGRNPIGSGAFKFSNWRTGTDVTLVRNDKFWGEKPKFSKMTLRFIPETASRAVELETGAADIVFDPGASDLERMKNDRRFVIHSTPGYSQMQILFNLSDKILKDIRVRKALAHALDVKSITQVVYGRYGLPAEGIFADALAHYHKIGAVEFNPEKAKGFLKEAGYGNGLRLTMSINNLQESNDIAELAQNMWAAIGVKVDIKTSAQQDWLAAARRGETQVMASAGTYTSGDPGQAAKMFDPAGDRMIQPTDPKPAEMMEKAMLTFDFAQRDKLYKEVQTYIYNNYYLVPVSTKLMVYLSSSKVENFPCEPGGTPYLGNIVVYE